MVLDFKEFSVWLNKHVAEYLVIIIAYPVRIQLMNLIYCFAIFLLNLIINLFDF